MSQISTWGSAFSWSGWSDFPKASSHCSTTSRLKCNAQGYKASWNGYKFHIDTADGGILVSAVLSSASMHDSLATIPLAQTTTTRITHLYDLMDEGYCSADLREYCRELNHHP